MPTFACWQASRIRTCPRIWSRDLPLRATGLCADRLVSLTSLSDLMSNSSPRLRPSRSRFGLSSTQHLSSGGGTIRALFLIVKHFRPKPQGALCARNGELRLHRGARLQQLELFMDRVAKRGLYFFNSCASDCFSALHRRVSARRLSEVAPLGALSVKMTRFPLLLLAIVLAHSGDKTTEGHNKGAFSRLNRPRGLSMMSSTTPAPTVRPPSRIAKRRPLSIAIGVMRVTVIVTRSPGMTISTPSGELDGTGHIGRTEVELGTVALEEWLVASALFLLEDVHLAVNLT